MSENYNSEEKEIIRLLVSRLFNKAKKSGYSYRQIAVLVKAKSHVSVWRWLKNKSLPSQHHIYYIKKFLGYSVN